MIKILFASRLVYEKGVDILIECIESFAGVPELTSHIEWHICSDGEARDTIIDLASKYENVTYHGRLSQDKLQELYKASDILFMPSRFLETFGLTALEALTSGTPVCAPAKGGLRPFVTVELALDESRPVASFREVLEKRLAGGTWDLPDIESFSERDWDNKLSHLFAESSNILIVHDYEEKIGGAEYYIELTRDSLQHLGKNVFFYGYSGQTTIWKRRIMFVLSILAFWRGIALYRLLSREKIDTIWMHSILRYIGPWGVLAICVYTILSRNTRTPIATREYCNTRVFLSHHDIGLLAAFPQDITQESSIPVTSCLRDFIPDAGIFRQIISIGKYIYVVIIRALLPRGVTHIIFAPFLEIPIRGQFTTETSVDVFPHKTIARTSSGGAR